MVKRILFTAPDTYHVSLHEALANAPHAASIPCLCLLSAVPYCPLVALSCRSVISWHRTIILSAQASWPSGHFPLLVPTNRLLMVR